MKNVLEEAIRIHEQQTAMWRNKVLGYQKQLVKLTAERDHSKENYDIVYENFVQLEEDYDKLKDKHRWIPVSERLPEDNTNVLVCSDEATISVDRRARYTNNTMWLNGKGYITHWKPIILPEVE